MKKHYQAGLLAGLLALSPSVALPFTLSEVPQAIQDAFPGITAADVAAEVSIGAGHSAFLYEGTDPRTGESYRYGFGRYQLHEPSAQVYNDYEGGGGSTTTPYSGYMWVQGPAGNIGEPYYTDDDGWHDFWIYSDFVDPGYDTSDFTTHLQLSNDALVSGNGYYVVDENFVESGNMRVDPDYVGLPLDLDSTFSLEFNLAYLAYDYIGEAGGLSSYQLDVGEEYAANLLYRDSLSSYGYSSTSSFYVNAVPLPSTIVLFAPGAAVLLGLRRRS